MTTGLASYRFVIDNLDERTNDADRLSRRFAELFTAGDRDEWLAMLSPDQVTNDRRPVIGIDTAGVDELANLYPRDRDTNPMSSTIETVAVRGESFALIRWRAVSGSGREWDALHLTRWSASGLNLQNVIFPVEQLDEAIAELDRLYEQSRTEEPGTDSAN